ncbi:hypothetical protein CR513_18415, partial [Mucuna pruriens]
MYGSHIGDQALASKVSKAGYYWPTLKHDCLEYVKKCDTAKGLQMYIRPHQSNYIRSCHPSRHFPIVAEQIKYLIVAVNYFIKWVEVEPVATISAERVKCFY